MKGWIVHAFPEERKIKHYFSGDLVDLIRTVYYLTVRLYENKYKLFAEMKTNMLSIGSTWIYISENVVISNPDVSRLLITADYKYSDLVRWKIKFSDKLYNIVEITVKLERMPYGLRSYCEVDDFKLTTFESETTIHIILRLVKRPDIDILDSIISEFDYSIWQPTGKGLLRKDLVKEFKYLKDIRNKFKNFDDLEKLWVI